jgi:acetyltransferase-like isoleucine patch superfamily enzyme
MRHAAAVMTHHGVEVDTIHARDHQIAFGMSPDMTEHGAERDDWPALYARILKADILVLGTPIWLGVKSSVLRGVSVGAGTVVAAHAVVNKDVPPMSVVVGIPGRVVKNRVEMYDADAARRAAIADIARKTSRAAQEQQAAGGGSG